MVGATISLGTALYPALGGILGEMDWTWPFWVSLCALPVGLLALRVPLERPHAGMDWKRYGRESRAIILHPAAVGLFGLTFLCFCILYGPTITYFPLLADELFQASPSQIGGVFTVASIGTASIAMNLAWLGKKYPHRRLLLAAVGLYLAAQSLMLALPDRVGLLWWLALPIFLGGAAQGSVLSLAERPHDYAGPYAQPGHRHGHERHGAAVEPKRLASGFRHRLVGSGMARALRDGRGRGAAHLGAGLVCVSEGEPHRGLTMTFFLQNKASARFFQSGEVNDQAAFFR